MEVPREITRAIHHVQPRNSANPVNSVSVPPGTKTAPFLHRFRGAVPVPQFPRSAAVSKNSRKLPLHLERGELGVRCRFRPCNLFSTKRFPDLL